MSGQAPSQRLAAVLEMVGTNCGVLADIGTDHAHLPIAALRQGLCLRAIATDIAAGPLSRAAENIAAAGFAGCIETRLGDGLSPLVAGEASTIVITGMGGLRIRDMLARSLDAARQTQRLVLGPQHDIEKLRRGLHTMGYDIISERLVREGERFYILLAATPAAAGEIPAPWTAREYYMGRFLSNQPRWNDFAKAEADKLARYIQVGAQGQQLMQYRQRMEWLSQ